ncbi:MAG: NUDIX hydrolase [Crocinitomicaceae bacterium]|jgi:8-oxo-dGTP pyrophosphatase MutT (NUDIX family)|tara:strand:+ start:48853 stop:49299 length:447 start_codon:yes stop_codon:yes gene_type:complete
MIRFNQRAYGLLINESQDILISDEFRFDTYFRKFPGGGVEYGEGIIDALKREFHEELGLHIESYEFLYFNDYFQESTFHVQTQVTCFYYIVKCQDIGDLGKTSYDLPLIEEGEYQKWMPLRELTPDMLTFKIDRDALSVLKIKLALTS